MFQNATLASALARCFNCWSLAMSPIAHTPSTFVAIVSSITIRPRSRSSMPPAAASSRSVFGSRPVATSSSSTTVISSPHAISMPSAVRRTAVGVCPRWRSTRVANSSVKRSAMSWSKPRSRRGRPREQRHLRTEPGEDVSHLGGDESSADDPEPWRQGIEAHDRIGRVEPGLHEAADRRDDRPGTGGDQHLRGPDDATVDVEHLVADEPRRALDQRQVRRARRPILPTARGDRDRSGRRCGRG